MRVSEYMSQPALVAAPEDGARDTFFRMRRARVRHLPVLQGARLVGILSDRDLRRPEWVDEAPDLAHPYELDDGLAVADLMTQRPISVHTFDPLERATALFLEHGFGSLPVLDKGGHLVGILTKLDLIRAFQELLTRQPVAR